MAACRGPRCIYSTKSASDVAVRWRVVGVDAERIAWEFTGSRQTIGDPMKLRERYREIQDRPSHRERDEVRDLECRGRQRYAQISIASVVPTATSSRMPAFAQLDSTYDQKQILRVISAKVVLAT